MRADFPPRAPPVTGGGRERRPASSGRREGPRAQRGGARQGDGVHPEVGEGEAGETQEAAGEGEGRGRECQVQCRRQEVTFRCLKVTSSRTHPVDICSLYMSRRGRINSVKH